MALAPFFDRIYGSIGAHLPVSRDSLARKLNDTVVGIRCADGLSDNEICIAHLAANLTARLYPTLAIPDSNHSSELRDLAKKINPQIEFKDQAPDATTICIGGTGSESSIHPSSSGWVAQLGPGLQKLKGPSNPYAASAAACLACAQLFRRIFSDAGIEKLVRFSLLDFESDKGAELELPECDLGEFIFAGVGAVGNAALWTMSRHAKLTGKVHVVDGERIELSNLQRYVLAMNADRGAYKVGIAAKTLSTTSLVVEQSKTTLQSFANNDATLKVPTIVVSVDNVEGRRAAQALLPKRVISGWTSERGLGASWHELSRDAACLACLYQPTGPGLSQTEQAARALGLQPGVVAELWVTRRPLQDAEIRTAASSLGVDVKVLDKWHGKSIGDLYTDVVCGAIPLDLEGIGKVEVVPLAHQSALAGVFMAAELVKRVNSELCGLAHTEVLISWDDVLKPTPSIWRKPRPREPHCICSDADYQAVYKAKWE